MNGVGAVTTPTFGIPLELGGLAREILSAGAGVTVIVFDRDLRVRLAEGDEFRRLGLDITSIKGRVLPEVLSAASWAKLKDPYEGALAGRVSTFDFSSREGVVYSIRVSPLNVGQVAVGALALAHDVTELRRLGALVSSQEVVARDSERLMATAFDRAPTGMSIIATDGRWLRVNDALCRMLGYDREELVGRRFLDFTHPDDVEADAGWLGRARAGETHEGEREKRYIARDGSIVWVLARVVVVPDDDGLPAYTVSLLQDITERRVVDQALRTSERRLRSILDNSPNAVALKGRDARYELVNRAFEQRFDLEPGWILGRRDTDFLAPGVAAAERESHECVLRTRGLVEREEIVPRDGENRVYQTVKFPLCDEDDEIYAVCGISNDITERKRDEEELRDRLAWTERIHAAVVNDRLFLHGQPIIDIASGEIEQAELLVRMIDPHDPSTLIPPAEFLPAAERFGLIREIDRWVVASAVQVAKEHRVEINLSGRTISDPAQVDHIERLVVESGAPPANITFEITETAVAENMESAREFAERLRGLGCSFALDDFGVGFGTFTYLKHLSVDYLKIDLQFVRDLMRSDTDRQVVSAIIGVARDFGIKTIAEGVEDQATLETLGLMGVDYAQGYGIGGPMPIDELWPTTTEASQET